MATETSQGVPAERTRLRLPGRRMVILIIALVVVAAAATFGVRYFQDAAHYVSSDDALVDSNLVPIAPLGSGTLAIWRVQAGDKVRAGQVLGQVRPATGSAFINVTAPINGTVLRVDGKEGQVVGQAQSLAYVADLDNMRITAYIGEDAISKVRPGQQVEATVDAMGGTTFHGTVREILPATAGSFALLPSADRTNGNFTKVTQRVEVHIDIGSTANMPLYPGENANVRIRTSQ